MTGMLMGEVSQSHLVQTTRPGWSWSPTRINGCSRPLPSQKKTGEKRERSVWSEMGSILKLSRFSRSQFVFFSGVVRGGLDGHTGLKLVCTWQVSSSFSTHYLTLPHITSLSFARSAQYSCYSVNSGVHVATVCIILRELNGLHVIIHRWYKK